MLLFLVLLFEPLVHLLSTGVALDILAFARTFVRPVAFLQTLLTRDLRRAGLAEKTKEHGGLTQEAGCEKKETRCGRNRAKK